MLREKSFNRGCRGRAARRGAIVVLVAASLVVLLIAALFSVDVAYMHLAHEQLHVATDAAAKAAVTKLSLGGSKSDATNQAIAYAAKNIVGGKPLKIDANNIQLGGVNYVSNGRWTFTPNANPLIAATVTVDMKAGTTPGAVNLFFGSAFNQKTFSPKMTSTAAFVRNKVCLCFDRSRSMTFDTSGTDEKWPTSTSGYPYGMPSSVGSVKIGSKTYDFRQIYPPCNNSRWSYLTTASTTFLDVLAANTSMQTPVSLITWASSIDNSNTKDVNNKYHTYTGATLNTNNSITSYPAYTQESTFVTDYTPLRTAITNKGKVTMLGGTDMNTGLQQAVNLFASTDDGKPWNKIIILFSDGCYNVGSNPVTNAAANAAKANIVVHTVGFLLNASDSAIGEPTLQSIADVTRGRHYRATDGASLKQSFEDLARSLPVILTQ
jgi:Ca-activated chloride channel family protein